MGQKMADGRLLFQALKWTLAINIMQVYTDHFDTSHHWDFKCMLRTEILVSYGGIYYNIGTGDYPDIMYVHACRSQDWACDNVLWSP